LTDAPEPPPVLAPPLAPTPADQWYQFPPHQAPPAPPEAEADQPPQPQYVTELQLIELAVPFPQLPATEYDTQLVPFAQSPAPPLPPVEALPPL
jgi:hypothetical protein